MKKIGIILALFIGVLSVQAQSFDFDCAEGVLPMGGGITAGNILSHRNVTLNTITGKFIVEGVEFIERDGSHYAPEGWVHPYDGSEFRFHINESGQGIGFIFNPFDGRFIREDRSFHINQFEDLVDVLLDEFKGPAIFYHGNKLSVNNKYLRSDDQNMYFETDNGFVYGGEVRGHIKFHLHNGVWDLDLKKYGRDRVYRSNLSFDELEGLVRIASVDFQSAYNQLSTVGYNETDRTLWYGSKRWANVPGQPNQWQQPSNLVHNDGISRHIVVTRISANRWHLKYNKRLENGNFYGEITTLNDLGGDVLPVFSEISDILKN